MSTLLCLVNYVLSVYLQSLHLQIIYRIVLAVYLIVFSQFSASFDRYVSNFLYLSAVLYATLILTTQPSHIFLLNFPKKIVQRIRQIILDRCRKYLHFLPDGFPIFCDKALHFINLMDHGLQGSSVVSCA